MGGGEKKIKMFSLPIHWAHFFVQPEIIDADDAFGKGSVIREKMKPFFGGFLYDKNNISSISGEIFPPIIDARNGILILAQSLQQA